MFRTDLVPPTATGQLMTQPASRVPIGLKLAYTAYMAGPHSGRLANRPAPLLFATGEAPTAADCDHGNTLAG